MLISNLFSLQNLLFNGFTFIFFGLQGFKFASGLWVFEFVLFILRYPLISTKLRQILKFVNPGFHVLLSLFPAFWAGAMKLIVVSNTISGICFLCHFVGIFGSILGYLVVFGLFLF